MNRSKFCLVLRVVVWAPFIIHGVAAFLRICKMSVHITDTLLFFPLFALNVLIYYLVSYTVIEMYRRNVAGLKTEAPVKCQ